MKKFVYLLVTCSTLSTTPIFAMDEESNSSTRTLSNEHQVRCKTLIRSASGSSTIGLDLEYNPRTPPLLSDATKMPNSTAPIALLPTDQELITIPPSKEDKVRCKTLMRSASGSSSIELAPEAE